MWVVVGRGEAGKASGGADWRHGKGEKEEKWEGGAKDQAPEVKAYTSYKMAAAVSQPFINNTCNNNF